MRSLIDSYIKNPSDSYLAIYSKQNLTAQSWPQVDNKFIDSVFSDMIANVNSGRLTVDRAIREAAGAISALMKQRLTLLNKANIALASRRNIFQAQITQLVPPCDPSSGNLTPNTGTGCGLDDAIDTIINITYFLSFYIAIPLGIIFLAVGGFKWLFSAGNESKITEGKNIIIKTVIALFIVIAAYAIISFTVTYINQFLKPDEQIEVIPSTPV